MASLSLLAGVPPFLMARELLTRAGAFEPGMSPGPEPPPALREAVRPLSEQAIAAALLEQLRSAAFAIYGPDDRIEAYEVQGAEQRRALDCTAAVFFDAAVQDAGDDARSLYTRPFGPMKQLCPGVRFYNQPSGATATGVLVGPDLVVTAAHVARRIPWQRMCLVFGFQMENPFAARERIPVGDVYRVAELVARGDGGETPRDWALLRLDRRAEGRPFAAINRDRPLAVGQAIYPVGHPMGLPVKFAGNARVLERGDDDIFTANLDVFPACSGSPVFNAETHALEGIVLADPTLDHFLPVDGCYVQATFPEEESVGNQHLRAHHFAGAVV